MRNPKHEREGRRDFARCHTPTHELIYKDGLFLTLGSVPETKIYDYLSILLLTYPYLVGNMASETTFDHWKVVFLMSKSEKK